MSGDRPGLGARTRRVALDALVRIERDEAFANLALPALLERSGFDRRDRAFVTDLVYGVTRRRAACDWLVERFLLRDSLEPEVRAALRLGAYQLVFTATPAHAAVSATVAAAPRRTRGLVNAVLRRVADAPRDWPDDATRLSYPPWLVELLRRDLGEGEALEALAAMNERPHTTRRADGYVQDQASQWVTELVGARRGERIAELCAAPGGKATGLARSGAWVAASDRSARRLGLVVANRHQLGLSPRLACVVADGRRPPYAAGAFDRVLVDAPCSGLGVLGRRPDARWRLDPGAPERLAVVQRHLLDAAAWLVRPGGLVVYSVCTLSRAETVAVDEHAAEHLTDFVAAPPPDAPWSPLGRGALLLPQAAGTDGMYLLSLHRGDADGSTDGDRPPVG